MALAGKHTKNRLSLYLQTCLSIVAPPQTNLFLYQSCQDVFAKQQLIHPRFLTPSIPYLVPAPTVTPYPVRDCSDVTLYMGDMACGKDLNGCCGAADTSSAGGCCG